MWVLKAADRSDRASGRLQVVGIPWKEAWRSRVRQARVAGKCRGRPRGTL